MSVNARTLNDMSFFRFDDEGVPTLTSKEQVVMSLKKKKQKKHYISDSGFHNAKNSVKHFL